MIIAFILSMPNVGSWNGKWTGEGTLYARVKEFENTKTVKKILEQPSYYYNFGDGWGASVKDKKVTKRGAEKIENNSKGFCGYDWMIDSIISYGEILNSKQRAEAKAK
jgi:hypothetical protein